MVDVDDDEVVHFGEFSLVHPELELLGEPAVILPVVLRVSPGKRLVSIKLTRGKKKKKNPIASDWRGKQRRIVEARVGGSGR